jgi:hypothetical protein
VKKIVVFIEDFKPIASAAKKFEIADYRDQGCIGEKRRLQRRRDTLDETKQMHRGFLTEEIGPKGKKEKEHHWGLGKGQESA